MPTFGAKGFDGLLQDVKNRPAVRETLKGARANVFLYDKSSPRTRNKRACARKQYLEISKALLVADGEVSITISDEELHRRCFNKDNVIEYTCRYLAALACSDHIKGHVRDKIQADVLRERASSLWWFASWELGFDVVSVWPVWDQTISALIHQHAIMNGLSTMHRAKFYFGIPELRLLFNHLHDRVRSLTWWKQQYLAWALSLITGLRPSSLGASRGYPQSQCLHWEDIEFLPNFNQSGKLAVRIHVKWLKGRRDPHRSGSVAFKPLTFLCLPPVEAYNLIADIPSLLFCSGFERGLFGKAKRLEDLLSDPSFRLPLDPDVKKLPVFLQAVGPNNLGLHQTDPMAAPSFNGPLQAACREVGLQCRVSMYVWRRECLTTIANNASNDVARQYAGHAFSSTEDTTLDEYYHYGPGDQDITALRLGENLDDAVTLRNRMRELLESPAIHRNGRFPFAEERDLFSSR